MQQGWIRELAAEVADLRARVDRLESRSALFQNGRQGRLCKTVADPDTGDYDQGADTHYIIFLDAEYEEDEIHQAWDPEADWPFYEERQPPASPIFWGHSLAGPLEEGDLVMAFWHNKQWWITAPFGIVAIRLAENHPGYRCATMQVWVGVEQATSCYWTFDEDGDTHTMIDPRCCEDCGTPYPDKYAEGFAYWRRDGKLACIDLDCCSPGSGYYGS